MGALVAVCGPAGVGKTALVTEWLRGLAAEGELPGGVLFADLSRRSGVGDVLGRWLRELGGSVPDALSERMARWRAITAGRGLAVFIDAAQRGGEVRALLPGAGCLTVVTSRRVLPELAEDAEVYRLGWLTDRAVADWLRRALAPGSTAGLAALAVACRGLPLVAGLVAGVLEGRPQWSASDLAGELLPPCGTSDVGEERVAVPPRETMRLALDVAYRALAQQDAGAAACYRRLGDLPRGVLDAGLISAVTGADAELAGGYLDLLHDRGLVDAVGEDLFTVGESVHRHAGEVSRAVDGEGTRSGAVRRYLEGVGAGLERLGGDPAGEVEWLAPRWETLVGAVHAVHAGAAAGLDALVVRLAAGLWPGWRLFAPWAAMTSCQRMALDAARRLGDAAAELAAHQALAVGLHGLGGGDAALAALSATAGLAGRHGARAARAQALHDLGRIHGERGETGEAREVLNEALELRLGLGDERGAALTRIELALAVLGPGGEPAEEQAVQAGRWLQEAREVLLAHGDSFGAARALAVLGEATAHSAAPMAGLQLLRQAGEEFARLRCPDWQGRCLLRAAALAQHLGRAEEARRLFLRARQFTPGLPAGDTPACLARLGTPAS
ncbi:hypothetical protein RM780_09970 [Streptomyces sp. DSM 44917]|uniref:NB-ARC domain-containing protein n=1 Tax=Streptomyces boetiae TaxID=3075541 RepID=A0ABU2L6U4_9ACTN|nr:hypothetical protein [Streptomyces sp. DSM 44917]MDT0307289.1 hypothetical protein [Streptomyces sp. DSM 44917]